MFCLKQNSCVTSTHRCCYKTYVHVSYVVRFYISVYCISADQCAYSAKLNIYLLLCCYVIVSVVLCCSVVPCIDLICCIALSNSVCLSKFFAHLQREMLNAFQFEVFLQSKSPIVSFSHWVLGIGMLIRVFSRF